jgi:hypothetical protein
LSKSRASAEKKYFSSLRFRPFGRYSLTKANFLNCLNRLTECNMNIDSTLAIYQDILTLNTAMLLAVQAGNNEAFFELAKLSDSAKKRLRNPNRVICSSSNEIEQKVTYLKQVLSQDRTISNLLNPNLERYIG